MEAIQSVRCSENRKKEKSSVLNTVHEARVAGVEIREEDEQVG